MLEHDWSDAPSDPQGISHAVCFIVAWCFQTDSGSLGRFSVDSVQIFLDTGGSECFLTPGNTPILKVLLVPYKTLEHIKKNWQKAFDMLNFSESYLFHCKAVSF